MMAAPTTMTFIAYTPPPSNSNTLRPSQKKRSIPSLPSNQRTQHAAILSLNRTQRNAEARAEDRRHILIESDESDDDLPTLEELLRSPPRRTVSGQASSTRLTSQNLDGRALKETGTQAEEMETGKCERQGDTLDQPKILDDKPEEDSTDDEVDAGAGEVKTGGTIRGASPRSTLETSNRASKPPRKSADISGPWYDVEEERYVDWSAPEFGPRTPRDESSALASDQIKTFPALSIPPQDQSDEQCACACDITASSFEELGAHSSNQNPNDSNNGWTEDQAAELEYEFTLALGEQGNSLSTSAPSSPRPCLADALQDDTTAQKCTEITISSREELREASRDGTPAQGLEEWTQQETQVAGKTLAQRGPQEEDLVVDGGEVEMQQQEQVREPSTYPSGHTQSEINVRHSATLINKGHRHILPRSASSSGPSGTALCDETVLADSGEKRRRRDPHREIGSESLHSDDSDDAYNESNADLPPAKRQKLCEAPVLTASPRFRRPASSTSLELDDTQSQSDDRGPSTAVDNEQHHASHTSRDSSIVIEERSPKEDEEFDELAIDGYSQQGYHTEGSDNSADEDYTHNVGNEDDEEENIRPTIQRKSPLHSRDKGLRHRQPPASTLNKQLHTPRTSRSPSTTQASQSSAEYREWSFGGSFKRVKIGDRTTFHLEFTLDDNLDDTPEYLELSAAFKAIDKSLSLGSTATTRAARSTTIPPQNQHGTSCSSKKRNPWTVEEDKTLKKMREDDGCSWKEISAALPLHPQSSIEVRYSKKFSSGTGSRKRQRL